LLSNFWGAYRPESSGAREAFAARISGKMKHAGTAFAAAARRKFRCG
jgi:hypothetical protein